MKTKLLSFILLLGFSPALLGQICGTPPYSSASLMQKSNSVESNSLYLESSTGICVNVKFHIVRESNGTGGFNPSNLSNITDRLNESYNGHKIYFNSLGYDFIDNSTYYNIDDTNGQSTEFNALVQINNNPNAINVYLINDAIDYAGRANGIPSQSLVIENYYATTQVVSHEVGHCFDLLHTHETYYGAENSSNCTTAGDKVCDTPPDPGLTSSNLDFYCNYIGGNGYNPDTSNIMSYAYPHCLDHFTLGQNTRIRQAFASSSILQNVISSSCSIPELTGPDLMCYSNTTFTLQNGGVSVTWQVSSNLQIISYNNSSITVIPTNANVSASGYIKAILPFETLQKNIWIGKPNASNIVIWNSTQTSYPYNTTTTNTPVEFTVGYPPGNRCDILEAEWYPMQNTYIMNGSFPCDIDNGTNKMIIFQQPNTYYVKVRIRNSCGWSDWSSPISMQVIRGGYMYSAYPNPTSETLVIEKQLNNQTMTVDASGMDENTGFDTYELYDFSSNLISKGKLSNQTNIDVSIYKKGRYILKIRSNGKLETSHIIIE